jgi:hypothetical protein
MTKDKLAAELELYTKELELLVKKVPMLRQAHLKSYVKAT